MKKWCTGGGNKQAFLIGIILLVSGAVSLLFWGSRKEIWFCDEVYTYGSSNGFEQNWPDHYVDEWMSGTDVEAFFSADSDHLSLNDITVRLYSDHVPLYFWLFRIVSFFFFKGSGTIWIGLSINLFFYLLLLAAGYAVFLYLTKRPFLSGSVMFFTCVWNRLMIEQVTFLRMYVMLLCAEVLLLLTGLWISREIQCNKIPVKAFLCLFTASVTGFLTHYDYWVFYAVTATVFCSWFLLSAVKKKGKRFWTSREFWHVAAWAGNFVVSLVTTILIFPYCRWNLNRGKGKMALEALLAFSEEKADRIFWGYQRLSAVLFGERIPPIIGLPVIFGCIVGGGIVLFKRKEIRKLADMCLVVLAVQLYQIAVCFTMPAGWEERYLWGAFTIMALCMAWGGIILFGDILGKIRNHKVQAISRSVVGVFLATAVFIGQYMIIDGGNGVAYLSNPVKDVALLKENSGIPWIVYGSVEDAYSYYDWIMPEKICFLTVDNTQEDASAVHGLAGEEKFVLYVYNNRLSGALSFFCEVLGKDVESQYLTQSTNFYVYLIEVKQVDERVS